jgi:hypothetical protein
MNAPLFDLNYGLPNVQAFCHKQYFLIFFIAPFHLSHPSPQFRKLLYFNECISDGDNR